ncbi:glycosyltransferase [Flavobacterium sp. LS1R49]|uniref:Glycosyltransferase n=1 Tax=Flavobacterium shii TaxID=2987687 RepID=A0A9X3BXL9_9FLAO|nr:glycosyltransferase [Flavobacterium shii]MCV9927430.1 glycosyltransferase [Flavobacterium shii]
MKKIFIIGSNSQFGMERSYKSALEKFDFEVEILDFNNLCNSYIPIKFLKRLGLYIDIIPSITRGNHFVSKKIFAERPHAIIVFTNVRIFPGAIEYFKIFCNNVSFYWPDSIVNMSNSVFSNLKYYHNIYTHSEKNVEIFASNGIISKWLPFAGDILLSESYNPDEKRQTSFDFSFVGAYRPERFEAINELMKSFENSRFLIVGLGWKKLKFCNENNLEIVNKMVDLNTFLEHTTKSKIALNAIDHMNYPSSNLRFFEIALSSVPQLSTFVPEFKDKFIDKEHVFYYRNLTELVEAAKFILENYDEALLSAAKFRKLIDLENNYYTRSQFLVNDFV